MSSPFTLSRRNLLKAAGAAGVASAFFRRRSAFAAPLGSVKRVIVVHCPGGVRWNASFDAQPDVNHNPWGLLPWSMLGRGTQPQWGFSRMFLQRPLPMNATNWSGVIYPYLTSTNAANYNLAQPTLTSPGWNSALMPTLADVANDIAVVRVTGNPGGQFNSDHGSAGHALVTGFTSGQIGMGTVLQAALKDQMGAAFDTTYPLPAMAIGSEAWTFGIGQYSSSRPIFIGSALSLPASNPGATQPVFSKKIESDLDAEYAQYRQAFMGQSMADFVNDKTAADLHIGQLVNPALHFEKPPGTSSLGTLIDGTTPVTNQMLYELFGIDSKHAPAGDILFDVFGALSDQPASSATWIPGQHTYGLNGALAIRLLQMGAPIVSITQGAFDSHSGEVIDPSAHKPQTVHVAQLGRLMAALNFALRKVEDPAAPGHSLWETTVVFACSEFGRGVGSTSLNGFTDPAGQADGGSGHDPWCAWPMMGGPVVAPGQLLKDTANGGFFHQNRIFSSVLKGFGVQDANNAYIPYGTFPTLSGLLNGV